MCQELEIEEAVNPKIATCFAGGIGNTGSVCGAVAGAVMAIGLKRDSGDSMEEMMDTLGLAQEFRQRFETEMGAIACRELTGADLTTPEGREAFMNSDIPEKVCFPAVGTAYRLVLELLKEPA